MHSLPFVVLLATAVSAADPRTSDVAMLVNENDTAAIVEPLKIAITNPRALVRATAARVVNVREVHPALEAVRAQLGRETDAVAAREEIRAIAALGSADDVETAITAARKWPSSIDGDLALAVASRGGVEALQLYPKLRSLRRIDRARFFRIALWRSPALISLAAARIIAEPDAEGWQALLGEARDTRLSIDPGVLKTGLTSNSEEIRAGTAWYVVSLYAADPSQIPEILRDHFAALQQAMSDREAFAGELVARMTGREPTNDPRWTQWLQSVDADAILGGESGSALYQWFTDDEFALRKQRCGLLPFECAMPAARPKSPRGIAPRPVAPPDFMLPGVLPPGLASEMLPCSDGWLGVATVAISPAGRVMKTDLRSVAAGRCTRALEAILRLSLPTPAAITSPHESANVVLVRAPRQPLCLDEAPPSESTVDGTLRVGGKVVAPKVLHRVEPWFPESARRSMGSKAISQVVIVLECVITREGCVRDIRVVGQTPYSEVNGAAVLAVSQWTFQPGTLDGEPVDVLFNLTVAFKIR